MLKTGSDHSIFNIGLSLAGTAMRTRRSVMQTGLALELEASDPLVGALPADPHRLRDMRDRHPLAVDTVNEQTSTLEREPGITVRHEDLLACEDGNLHTARRSSPSQGPVTNLSAEYT